MAELCSPFGVPNIGKASQFTTMIDPARWYAIYTRFRYEKQVAAMLAYRGVEHYLPLYEAVHRWKDRNARVQLPLFPSYVFVYLNLQDRMRALTIPGVIRLVGCPHAEPLEGEEVEAIRNYLSSRLPVEPYPYLTKGSRVRITGGPLAGMEGLILRRKSTCRIVISLDLIQRSMVVEVPASDLEATGIPVQQVAAA
ncbi:MAG TPA: UpxY family transcription antiterminator [Terriglobales bacterium]|nr:UpxY family transcription antiterminator [Terriglobales bacterium]